MRSCLSIMVILVASLAPTIGGAQRRDSHASGPTPAKTGTISVTVALVDDEMQVRPVPLHALTIASAGADTFTTRTGVDGTTSIAVPPGDYTLSSVAPTLFQGRRYRWTFPLSVTAGAEIAIALTNDNAAIEQVPGAVSPALLGERVDAAAALFERLQGSVFRVEGGLSHGTGFLADSLGGVILTNAHVVETAEATHISVLLDAQTRVRAQLLARDEQADVAVLRVHPDRVHARMRIPLQDPVGRAPVVPGERIAAMGYPLSQELVITTGIASSVRAGAVISDVNINPGNSGGPLLNIEGEAIAMNTFAESSPSSGPGISGSILVAQAAAALARAAAELQRTSPPSPDLLPVMPAERLDIATLKAYADTTDRDLYRDFARLNVGGFELTLQTPARTFVAIGLYEDEIAKDRKKREARAGLSESERYSEVREYRDWCEYVGAPTTPVVGIAVLPKVGETGGSVFARMMLSQNLRATYKFKGDVRGVELFRNEEPVEPIRGGHAPMKVFIENQWVSLKDIADLGFYVFDAEVLQPDSTGAPPSIVVAIRDLKSPDELKCFELAPRIVAQAWNEFESFYREKRPQALFHRADAKATKGRKAARSNEFLDHDCDWSSGTRKR